MNDISRGWLLLSSGELGLAQQIAVEALRIDPEDGDAWQLLLEVLVARGQDAQVVDVGPQVLGVLPEDPRPPLLIGIANLRLGHYAEAAAMLRKAIALAPDDADAHGLLAASLAQLGDEAAARREADAAATLAPDEAGLHLMRGITLLELRDLDAAERSFLESLRLDPENADAHVYLGHIADRRFDRKRALEHNLNAARIDPRNAIATDNVVMLSKGMVGGAFVLLVLLLTVRHTDGVLSLSTRIGLLVAGLLALVLLRRFRRRRLPTTARNVLVADRRRYGFGSYTIWFTIALIGWSCLTIGVAVAVDGSLTTAMAYFTSISAASLVIAGVCVARKWRRRPPQPDIGGSSTLWTRLAIGCGIVSLLALAAVSHPVSRVLILCLATPLCLAVGYVSYHKRSRLHRTAF